VWYPNIEDIHFGYGAYGSHHSGSAATFSLDFSTLSLPTESGENFKSATRKTLRDVS
jgi:hypothetical protein